MMRWKKPPEIHWRRWFAWYPVSVEDTGETVWLERIWRRDDCYGSFAGVFVISRFKSDVEESIARGVNG